MYNSAEKQSSGKRNIMKAEPKELGEDYTWGSEGREHLKARMMLVQLLALEASGRTAGNSSKIRGGMDKKRRSFKIRQAPASSAVLLLSWWQWQSRKKNQWGNKRTDEVSLTYQLEAPLGDRQQDGSKKAENEWDGTVLGWIFQLGHMAQEGKHSRWWRICFKIGSVC